MKVRLIKKRTRCKAYGNVDRHGNKTSYMLKCVVRGRRARKEQRFRPYASLFRGKDIVAGSITSNKIGWGISYYASR